MFTVPFLAAADVTISDSFGGQETLKGQLPPLDRTFVKSATSNASFTVSMQAI